MIRPELMLNNYTCQSIYKDSEKYQGVTSTSTKKMCGTLIQQDLNALLFTESHFGYIFDKESINISLATRQMNGFGGNVSNDLPKMILNNDFFNQNADDAAKSITGRQLRGNLNDRKNIFEKKKIKHSNGNNPQIIITPDGSNTKIATNYTKLTVSDTLKALNSAIMKKSNDPKKNRINELLFQPKDNHSNNHVIGMIHYEKIDLNRLNEHEKNLIRAANERNLPLYEYTDGSLQRYIESYNS